MKDPLFLLRPDWRDLQGAGERLFATNEGPITRYLAACYGVSPLHP